MTAWDEAIARVEELGPEAEEVASALLEAFADRAERAEGECINFKWGDPCGEPIVIDFEVPDSLYMVGELVSVTYEQTKAGELHWWQHHFEEAKPVLAYSPETEALYIVGGDYTVEDRGIVG